MKVSSVSEMRAMDRYAIETIGIPEEVLMENAGMAASLVLAREVGIRAGRISVICGAGNNGGDGFVVARNIHAAGGDARVFILGGLDRFRGAAKRNLDIIKKLPLEIKEVAAAAAIRNDLYHSRAIVDALFGTGLDREVQGLHREVIDLINGSGRKVLSLDIPSGVNGDTGEVMGAAVKADCTVTFGLPKVGNLLYPGFDLGGKLFVTHITFPPSLHDSDSLTVQVNDAVPLPRRIPTAHKGRMGDVLFIAGAASYYGAPLFAALSFLKAGGGYSRLAAPKSVVPVVAQMGGEIVFHPQKETRQGSLAASSRTGLLDLARIADMVVLGPGLSLQEETQQLVRDLACAIDKPLLLDGDGITAVSGCEDLVRQRHAPTILTPHPGEMARMTGCSISEIGRRKVAILKETARRWNAFVVLKGAHSLIGTPDERIFINLSGNPGMATAGSGDVLTGTVAAMRGLGLDLEGAVRQGVFIHGLAGDLAAEEKGEDGITARDILDYLPGALKAVREGGAEAGWNRCEIPCLL
ncbi:MAG: NAD(P)H-hydrate dehydratase [Deltaproteobacteria bacterium]|nr:NAD(P)H-hydrate dehydratase [Deltaproteobacteria bacterium]